jgi:hypothetical protein
MTVGIMVPIAPANLWPFSDVNIEIIFGCAAVVHRAQSERRLGDLGLAASKQFDVQADDAG